MGLVCGKCGKIHHDLAGKWRCECGGYLIMEREPVFHRDMIRACRSDMWRYDAAYPLKFEDLAVSFNEGLTPLVRLGGGRGNVLAKMESLMLTGSFKDRGTVMVVNHLLRTGARRIVEDSSGNAGASVAAYCALGGVPCDIYVPAGNSSGKIIQIKSYGARLHEIEGSREDVAAAAQLETDCYAGHNWHPMFIEGVKSLAYELWEQSGFRAPENIIAPAGNGSLVLGIYLGFADLLRNKEIGRMPRIFAVQAEKCNPIYRLSKGLPDSGARERTVAEGIAIARPNKASAVCEAIGATGGEVLSIGEDGIIDATFELARAGIFAEPTSSATYAGLKELRGRGVLSMEDEVVIIISGNGLKTALEISKLAQGRR